MRCFLAVTVGESITGAVAATVVELREAADRAGLRISWTRPEGWHVTVKFLGEIDDVLAARVHEAVLGTFRDEPLPAFVIEAKGVVGLPPSGIPRVLAVALEDGGRLGEVACTVDTALAPLGFERERRPYVPHLTIGRMRERRPTKAGWKQFAPVMAAAGDRSFGRAEINAVGLYRSRLGSGGSRYERLQNYQLETCR